MNEVWAGRDEVPVVDLRRPPGPDGSDPEELPRWIEASSREFLTLLEERAEVPPNRCAALATWWTGPGHFPALLLHELLAVGGRAVVWVPRPGPAQHLPAPGQEALRGVVQALGEAGFTIVEDQPDAAHADLQRVVVQHTSLRCRFYSPGDEDAILALFHTSFGPHRNADHWRWKFAQNPYRNQMISLVEAEEGVLAAHYAGFAVPMLRATESGVESLLAMQMGDTMTHPDFRDVGRRQTALLPRSVRHFFSRYRSPDFSFYFGFNRGPIQRFCRWFIGGDRVEAVGYWQRVALGFDLPHPRRYTVLAAAPTEEWDALLQEVAPAYEFLVRKDREYVRWRYVACPDRDYLLLAARDASDGSLVGWAAFLRQDEVLQWGDVLVSPEHAACVPALLDRALADPRMHGVERIDAWFSRNPRWWCEEVERLGFERLPHPQGLAMVALVNPPLELSDLEALHTTWGDSDLF